MFKIKETKKSLT